MTYSAWRPHGIPRPSGESALQLDGNGGDARHDLHPQLHGSGLTTARAAHHRLEHLVDVVLVQARATLREVLANPGAVVRTHLAVEVLVNLHQCVGTVDPIVIMRGHGVAPSMTNPRSRA